jgi:hypothetical protein
LTVSSTLYFAVFPWSLADCGMWPRRVPSYIRKRLIRERLPQTLHTSCGLLLMVSQPAQNTALSRELRSSVRLYGLLRSYPNLFTERCLHAKLGSHNSSGQPTPNLTADALPFPPVLESYRKCGRVRTHGNVSRQRSAFH